MKAPPLKKNLQAEFVTRSRRQSTFDPLMATRPRGQTGKKRGDALVGIPTPHHQDKTPGPGGSGAESEAPQGLWPTRKKNYRNGKEST